MKSELKDLKPHRNKYIIVSSQTHVKPGIHQNMRKKAKVLRIPNVLQDFESMKCRAILVVSFDLNIFCI